MQKIRKISQIFFLLLIVVIPILNLMEIYFFNGSFISLTVGNLAISDPLAVFQAIFLSHKIVPLMLISILIPILIVIFFGRVWCSYACPYFLMTELIDKIKNKLNIKNTRNKNINTNRQNIIRYGLLLTGFIIIGILGVPLLYLISPPSVISTQMIMIIKHLRFTSEVIILLSILIVEIFFIYRFACRYLCPTGTLLSLFQFKNFGLKVKHIGSCSECNACIKECPLMLDPKTDGNSKQCNNCGICVDSCKDNLKQKTLFFKMK